MSRRSGGAKLLRKVRDAFSQHCSVSPCSTWLLSPRKLFGARHIPRTRTGVRDAREGRASRGSQAQFPVAVSALRGCNAFAARDHRSRFVGARRMCPTRSSGFDRRAGRTATGERDGRGDAAAQARRHSRRWSDREAVRLAAIRFASSDSSVARVTRDGRVQGLRLGRTSISATLSTPSGPVSVDRISVAVGAMVARKIAAPQLRAREAASSDMIRRGRFLIRSDAFLAERGTSHAFSPF